MTNPWNINDAFTPMFCDDVRITSSGTSHQVKACVFPIEEVDPFADSDNKSELKRLNILIQHDDWNYGEIKVGSPVQYGSGTYKIETVDTEQSWWQIVARK